MSGGDSPRDEEREADAGIVEEAQRGCPLHEREVPRRVLEQHRLVNHRELEMCRRIVDRNACVLGEQHQREGDRGEREARVDHEMLAREVRGNRGQRRGRRDQRRDENDHEERRLRQEADHHLATRSKRAECCSDIHSGKGQEYSRGREETHEGNRIRCDDERQPPGKGGDDGGGYHHRAEYDIGRDAKQWRCVLREHRVLVEQLADVAVRQQHARRAAVGEPRTALIHPAYEERRRDERDRDLERLRDEGAESHVASTTASRKTRVAKL